MMRSRNIKPQFFENEYLADCSPFARLLFIGIWTIADRNGVLEDRPRRIRVQVFPYETLDVAPLLEELVSGGFLKPFSVDGVNYLHVVNFKKHQKPHKNEKELYPEPNSDDSGQVPADSGKVPNARDNSRAIGMNDDVMNEESGSRNDDDDDGVDRPSSSLSVAVSVAEKLAHRCFEVIRPKRSSDHYDEIFELVAKAAYLESSEGAYAGWLESAVSVVDRKARSIAKRRGFLHSVLRSSLGVDASELDKMLAPFPTVGQPASGGPEPAEEDSISFPHDPQLVDEVKIKAKEAFSELKPTEMPSTKSEKEKCYRLKELVWQAAWVNQSNFGERWLLDAAGQVGTEQHHDKIGRLKVSLSEGAGIDVDSLDAMLKQAPPLPSTGQKAA